MESSSLGPSKRARLPTQIPSCLVDGCTADLTKCRDYHRRHKVCELHSKTARVFIKGHEQRFCQQCSRFHSLGEFDEGKRSCRKRLDGHNRRRRKPQPESLSMNSSRLFSNRHGTRYLHFGSSQVFSTTVAAASPWHPSSIKSENDSILDYSNSNSSSRQSTLNFIASNSSNNNKSSSTLLPSPSSSSTLPHQSCYTKGGPAGKQFPFLQQVPTGEEEEEEEDEEATAADDSSSGLQSSKLFVLDSNRALSLLSSPMVHHDLNPPNKQQSQSSVHSLSSCCYTGIGVESESIGSVLVAADGSNGNGGLFQIGPDDHDGGGGSNGNGSGSHHHHHHQTLSFSWQ